MSKHNDITLHTVINVGREKMYYQINSTFEGFCDGLNLELERIDLIKKSEAFVANGACQEFVFQDFVKFENDLNLRDGCSFRGEGPSLFSA